MGGKLFNLGRMPKDQYLEIESAIRQYLEQKIGQAAFRIPRYYAAKPDFGDLDVIIKSDARQSWQTLRQEFVTDLGITQVKSDGNVFSTVCWSRLAKRKSWKPKLLFLSLSLMAIG